MSLARKLGALFSGELLPVARVQGLGSLATKSTVTSSDVDGSVNIRRVGQVVQSVFQSNAANTVISATIPADSTPPQNTEGTQVLTATITPTSATNIIEVEAVVHGSELTNVGDSLLIALFRDAAASAVAASFVGGMNGGGNYLTSGSAIIRYRVAAGSTAATTFNVRAGNNAGSMTLNATHQNINLGGLIASTLTVREISA